MAKENKKTEEAKEIKCDCGPDCKCGCQEGKECHCGDKGCGCGCSGGCPCKRIFGKVLFLALVFFAGMGVNEFMNDTCMGRCPARRAMPPMPMMQAPQAQGNLPFFKDSNGSTIVIVNTGEENGSHTCKCNKHHGKDGDCPFAKKHVRHHFDKKPMPQSGASALSE